MSNFAQRYQPDILECLADLSNDEVFTPPKIANLMLDLLPQEIWKNPDIKILDPATKSGVFLREAAKRLLEAQIPNYKQILEIINNKKSKAEKLTKAEEDFLKNLQNKINHIFTKQLYGFPITELTALLSRRSVYCAVRANSQYSVISNFNDEQGNIRFFEKISHEFEDKTNKCKFCGASKNSLDRGEGREKHAYSFLHYQQLLKLWENLKNMKFNVIIGNPPYQLADGGGTGSSAIPIYHLFIQQAKKLNPDYLIMITPSRWFAGGRGLDDFREEMLADKRIKIIHDYPNPLDVFPAVKVEGGVNYFLWDIKHKNNCMVYTHYDEDNVVKMERPLIENNTDTFIRYNEAIPILRKIQKFNEKKFNTLISSHKPFGIRSFENGQLTKQENFITLYTSKGIQYIDRTKITQNIDAINKYKVYIAKAYGMGNNMPYKVINFPIYGEPNSVCTETYLLIGTFDSKKICENVMSYIKTRFFRFLVLLKKNTQNTAKATYSFVPQQDFSKSWTDEELYKKYGLDEEEIAFIERMIKPME